MSEFNESASTSTVGAPRWVGLAVAVLGGLSLIGLGVGWSALNQARSVEQTTQSTLKQAKTATKAVDKKVTNLETSVKAELATKANTDDVNKLNGDVTGVKTDLDATKNSIQMARSEMGTL